MHGQATCARGTLMCRWTLRLCQSRRSSQVLAQPTWRSSFRCAGRPGSHLQASVSRPWGCATALQLWTPLRRTAAAQPWSARTFEPWCQGALPCKGVLSMNWPSLPVVPLHALLWPPTPPSLSSALAEGKLRAALICFCSAPSRASTGLCAMRAHAHISVRTRVFTCCLHKI